MSEISKKLKRIRKRDPANKECFNCTNPGPRDLITNFNIFVCSHCATYHRFYTHRTKSIGCADLTEQELRNLRHSGTNSGAKAIWRVGWVGPKPNPNDGPAVKKLIQDTFQNKKWYVKPQNGQPQKRVSNASHPPIQNAPPLSHSDPVAIQRPPVSDPFSFTSQTKTTPIAQNTSTFGSPNPAVTSPTNFSSSHQPSNQNPPNTNQNGHGFSKMHQIMGTGAHRFVFAPPPGGVSASPFKQDPSNQPPGQPPAQQGPFQAPTSKITHQPEENFLDFSSSPTRDVVPSRTVAQSQTTQSTPSSDDPFAGFGSPTTTQGSDPFANDEDSSLSEALVPPAEGRDESNGKLTDKTKNDLMSLYMSTAPTTAPAPQPTPFNPYYYNAYGGYPQNPAMMGQNPAMMGQNPAMMRQNPAMMGQNPAMMGQNPAMYPPTQPHGNQQPLNPFAAMMSGSNTGTASPASSNTPTKSSNPFHSMMPPAQTANIQNSGGNPFFALGAQGTQPPPNSQPTQSMGHPQANSNPFMALSGFNTVSAQPNAPTQPQTAPLNPFSAMVQHPPQPMTATQPPAPAPAPVQQQNVFSSLDGLHLS